MLYVVFVTLAIASLKPVTHVHTCTNTLESLTHKHTHMRAHIHTQNFRPGPGRVTTYLAPGGPHVRMDSHLYPGYLVPPNYDSLLGKLIVWGEDREQVRFFVCVCAYVAGWLCGCVCV